MQQLHGYHPPMRSFTNAVPALDEFLAQPLVARLATNGPTVRPLWFLWEDDAFWWLTGSYSKLPERLARDPKVSLVIDACDLATGTVLQVISSGTAKVVPMDPDRARRKLRRYLGEDEHSWPERFQAVFTDPDARLAVMTPRRPPRLIDQSFTPG